ncbi:septum formation inhibitor MinC, partial [Methylobacterium trifolii]
MSQAPPDPVLPEAAAAPVRLPLAFRGRAFKALALTPETPLQDWLAGLDAALKRSPTLFDGRAVVLDLAALKPEPDALRALVDDLARRRIRILGLEGADEAE